MNMEESFLCLHYPQGKKVGLKKVLFSIPPPPPLFLPIKNIRYDTSGKCSHLQNKGISEPFFHLKTRFSLPPWITPFFYPLIFLGLLFLSACSGGSSDSSSSNASNDKLEECSAGMVAGEEENVACLNQGTMPIAMGKNRLVQNP